MNSKQAFAFGKDFQKLTGEYDFKDIAAYINGEENTSGQYSFHKLKPLFDKYGYSETIAAIKEETGTAAAVKEMRPDTEIAEEFRARRIAQ